MMDWTDRHCRFFHRRFTRRTLLYTEMVTTGAVLRGDRERLLAYDPAEHPLALQLGGADPEALARAAAVGCAAGFDEINLNVGCPSDRVQSGCFGAALMRTPDLVAECAAAMIAAAGPVPVTVKCRIGVDDQDPEVVLPAFLERMATAGVRQVAIHARKAWLEGLSPKENREIPPLDYPLVLRMRAAFPDLALIINGGITGLDQAAAFLAQGAASRRADQPEGPRSHSSVSIRTATSVCICTRKSSRRSSRLHGSSAMARRARSSFAAPIVRFVSSRRLSLSSTSAKP
jgi:tRNA-dihydrouridine synthase A